MCGRPADIPLLVAHFADKRNRTYHEEKQVSQLERDYYLAALDKAGGNKEPDP
jgi:DNA-binding NtrC family response regulator